MKSIYHHTCFRLAGCLLMLSLFAACKKDIEIEGPVDQLVTQAVFADSGSAENTVIGLYLRQAVADNSNLGFLHGGVTLFPALSADELYNTSVSANYDQFSKNGLLATNPMIANNWSNAYNVIYHANTIIENLSKASPLSPQLKSRLMAEAKFFRALNYFYLTSEYGAVPLALGTDYRANSLLARSDTAAVYSQVISDLKDAQAGLSTEYPGTQKVRVNRHGVSALLARVYLYQQQYGLAQAQASSVIGSQDYSLAPVASAFLPDNKEAILQFLPPQNSINATAEGLVLLPIASSFKPNYAFTDQLKNAFETGDLRKTNWVGTNTVAGLPYLYARKYKVRLTFATLKPEYSIVLRLAEQYLIRAEARCQQNDLSGAIADLDMVRQRAGLPLLADTNPGISRAALLEAIFHERQVELFCEWGHRWFDLKRSGRINAVMTAAKGTSWDPRDALYPIPAQDIANGPNLSQNPGYTAAN